MRAFKGFEKRSDGTMWCIEFQYEVGKTYKHEGEIKLCESGFHACHELHQVCGGEIIESEDDDGKFVCSEIRLVKEIDMTDVAKFNIAWSFSEGFALVVLDGKWNFIDTSGNLLSEQWYDWVYSFSEGFAIVKLNGKLYRIDKEGKIVE